MQHVDNRVERIRVPRDIGDAKQDVSHAPDDAFEPPTREFTNAVMANLGLGQGESSLESGEVELVIPVASQGLVPLQFQSGMW